MHDKSIQNEMISYVLLLRRVSKSCVYIQFEIELRAF